MKKFMINAFATTGISLIMLSFVALAFHAKCIYLETVFQVFVVNVLSHLLIMLIRKMDFRSNSLEMMLELISLESELLIFGWLFHWFTSVSVGILVIMGVMIYVISLFLNLLQMKQAAKEINALIQRRRMQ